MFKDTLQISAELIEAALRLHGFKLRHKWRVGDQFCVAADCEIFWQSLYADAVYLVDSELLNLIDELHRQQLPLEDDLEKMVFIPRLEDIVEFCAATVLTLELRVEHEQHRTCYSARINVAPEKSVQEESASGLRVTALRVLAAALQHYFPTMQPNSSLTVPI